MLVIVVDDGGGRSNSRKTRRVASHLTMLRDRQNFLHDEVLCPRDIVACLSRMRAFVSSRMTIEGDDIVIIDQGSHKLLCMLSA